MILYPVALTIGCQKAVLAASSCVRPYLDRADEDTELEPRELADRNEILRRCRSKGGILMGIWDEQELAAIRANPGATNISRHNGERAFKKVSRCSLQQTEAAFVLLGVTTSGEKP